VAEALAVHTLLAVVVGLSWWALAPQVTYTLLDGQPFVLGETESRSIFDGDAVLMLLCAAAGLAAGGWLLARGYRGALVPLVLGVGGLAGSVAAWLLAVQLGPGRLDDLVAAAGEGEVVAGPELNAYAVLLVWPILAVAVAFVVAAFSEPERTRRPSWPESAQ
jgi:hypothetical protein